MLNNRQQHSTNYNNTFTANIENTTNPSPVGGLFANAPPAPPTVAVINQSLEPTEVDIIEGTQEMYSQENTTNED